MILHGRDTQFDRNREGGNVANAMPSPITYRAGSGFNTKRSIEGPVIQLNSPREKGIFLKIEQ